MRYLWLVVPIIMLYPLAYVLVNVVDREDRANAWWNFPAIVTCLAVYMAIVAGCGYMLIEQGPEVIERRAWVDEQEILIEEAKKEQKIREKEMKTWQELIDALPEHVE